MRKTQFVLMTIALALLISATSFAQQTQASPEERKKQFAAMAARSGLPTEQHKLLTPFVGKFDQISKVALGPGDPITFHAIGTGTWIMGGRFVQVNSTSAPDEEVKGDRMHIFGFDPTANKFTLWGIETGSLTPYSATGTYDDATKTFNFDGENVGPGGAKIPFHMTFKIEANGAINQTLTLGQPPRAMEVKVTHTPVKE